MAARTLKRSVKPRSAEPRSAARSAKAARKSAGGKTARPARTAAAAAKAKPKSTPKLTPKSTPKAKPKVAPKKNPKTKPKPKPAQARITRSAGGKAPVARTVQYRQGDGWAVIDVADGIAVHDAAFKSVHYLNHTAAIVFLLCKQPIGFDVLCAVFREEFGLKTAPKAELRTIIAQMEASGLLRTVQPGAAKAAGARPARKR